MELEQLKIEAAKRGFRLSRIPEPKLKDDDGTKKVRRAVYLQNPPTYIIRNDVDKDDDEFLTCTEGQIKVLEKLFPQGE